MSDPFTPLIEDHRRVDQLFSEYEQTGDWNTALTIFQELTVHSTIEEEMIYGLYRSKVDSNGADEARREHQEAKDLIASISAMGPDAEGVKPAMAQLKASVQHHVQEEESELFPKMADRLGDTVAFMGNDIVTRKAELKTQVADDFASGMGAAAASQKPNATPGSF
jgi:hemerythrin superfamily protein